jgi:hypothetical protein
VTRVIDSLSSQCRVIVDSISLNVESMSTVAARCFPPVCAALRAVAHTARLRRLLEDCDAGSASARRAAGAAPQASGCGAAPPHARRAALAPRVARRRGGGSGRVRPGGDRGVGGLGGWEGACGFSGKFFQCGTLLGPAGQWAYCFLSRDSSGRVDHTAYCSAARAVACVDETSLSGSP